MSNIDILTFGELKQLAAILNVQQPQPAQRKEHPFVGKYVICRCYSAGVHAGILVSQEGDQAILKDSRRLWSWKNICGVALSGLAENGIDASQSKIDTKVGEIALTGVIETIPASQVCEESINAAK